MLLRFCVGSSLGWPPFPVVMTRSFFPFLGSGNSQKPSFATVNLGRGTTQGIPIIEGESRGPYVWKLPHGEAMKQTTYQLKTTGYVTSLALGYKKEASVNCNQL